MQNVLVVVGPTASGKSALAVQLARKFNGEIISADSRQVYKGLNIGTGKITKREMKGVRHFMLDVVSQNKIFTANDFVIGGRTAIENIQKRNKLPIVCGGTGFYIDALLGRIELADVPPNTFLRKKLSNKTSDQLFALLQKKDPKRAQTIDRHNSIRLIRALEILAQQRHSKHLGETYASKSHLETIWVGIMPDRKVLREKIHTRLLQRMKLGMVKEAKNLHEAGLSWKRMDQLGLEYRYLALYLQNRMTKEEMLSQLENKIWQYAKRQMTYWKRNTDIRWFDSPAKTQPAIKKLLPNVTRAARNSSQKTRVRP